MRVLLEPAHFKEAIITQGHASVLFWFSNVQLSKNISPFMACSFNHLELLRSTCIPFHVCPRPRVIATNIQLHIRHLHGRKARRAWYNPQDHIYSKV